MENEIFVDVLGYEGLYMISSYGRVYSVKRNKFLKPCKDKDNYLYVGFSKNGKKKNYKIHRLVGQAFLPNPLNLLEVNHISEIKSDNRVENLEWMSHKENCIYGTRTQRQKEKCSKSVLQFTKQGEFVKEYPSVREASRQTRIFQSAISSCCNGKRHSAGKYLWKFKEEVA